MLLYALTDELECCRIAEQQLRDEMHDAVRAAEAEAHKKAEDAYQEASYAGEGRWQQLLLHIRAAASANSSWCSQVNQDSTCLSSMCPPCKYNRLHLFLFSVHSIQTVPDRYA